MGFTELTFLFVFLPVSIIIYLLADKIFHKDVVNNAILVAFSLLFYFWAGKGSLFIFLAIAFFTYMAGQMVENVSRNTVLDVKSANAKQRVAFHIMCLVGILAFYKYAVFVVNWINKLLGREQSSMDHLIVPIGLSFVIFESVSYVVDTYRGDAKAGSLLDCLTFLSLFPKLVSGPIVFWKDFKPQLKDRTVSLGKITKGIDLIIIGYAKKAIIADTLGSQIVLVNNGINTTGVDIQTMWLRALLYFFQLYFDFSGYSDIAIGLCSIFGFEIKENFNYPYLSKSITEFWRRWHISLGSWFREYVYIPLGGNRRGNVYIHLFLVFILTGIWHGTGFPYLIWGGINGIYVVLERVLKDKSWYKMIPGVAKWMITMMIIFGSWIMFMSTDIMDAWKNYTGLFVPMTEATVTFTWRYYLTNRAAMFLVIAIVGQVFGIGKVNNMVQMVWNTNVGSALKRILLLLLFVADILFIVNSTYSPFIYFQF